MNSLNDGSREACERLFKAGIVLETEHWHGWDGRIYRKDEVPYGTARVPAPSMEEVNQDLPESDREVHLLICRYLDCGLSDSRIIGLLRNINKMINFLIWVTEQRKEPESMMGKVTKDTIIIGR